MTDLMLRPDDTGEIQPPDLGGGETILLRPVTPPTPPTVDLDGATTRLVPPPRRPAADDTGEILYRADRDAPATVGDLDARGCRTVAPNDEDFTTAPAAPPRPLPTPPAAPKPADDQAAAQPVGPLERVAGAQVRYLGPKLPWRRRQAYKGKHQIGGVR